MQPLTFQGDAFSEYFCTRLLGTDPQLRPLLVEDAATQLYGQASSVIRFAQRQLRDRERARSTATLLLKPLAEILGWHLGERGTVATEEGDEEAGVPLLSGDNGRILGRAVCIPPDAHLDAAPSGLNRRFAPTLALARVLREENLTYGVLLNAYELRLLCVTGTLPSFIGFDLSALAEKTDAGLAAWKLLFPLLRQEALVAQPPLLDQVRTTGKQHQQRVSTALGSQVQQAVLCLLQGVLDHPANKDQLSAPITDPLLHELYQETLRLLYRLLFILYAEDLTLLPMDMLTYREGYSLHRLLSRARGDGSQSLEASDPNGSFFQDSLQALFQLLRRGIDLGPEGRIRPYSGGLFDPGGTQRMDRLTWGNATVGRVLDFLTRVPAPRGQVGMVRLSYRELNVEQLGSIYEGLLEQVPAYADRRLWRAELDSRPVVVDDATRERIRAIRGERLGAIVLQMDEEEEDEPELSEDEPDADQTEEAEEEAAEDEPRPRRSAKKPLKVLAEIPTGRVFLKGGLGRKQTGSYYTNRAFVDFLVREALDPLAIDKSPKEILSLKVLDPAMGSGHFLVGTCRRLAEHLLAAYRREVAQVQRQQEHADLSETDCLELADLPTELIEVWNSPDQERELAVCRLFVAGNCLYGVDKNPLAVDLAKVSLWLVTAAAQHPLTFLDHRLCCGDSLLGIPAEEVVRPWIAPTPRVRKSRNTERVKKPVPPVSLLISPRHDQETFEFEAPSKLALCQAFARAFLLLKKLHEGIVAEPTNFALHRARHVALQGILEPWRHLHQLRVGLGFSSVPVEPDLINDWLRDLLERHHISEEQRQKGEPYRRCGEEMGAFCWELAFPEVFYDAEGNRLAGGGFSCVLGNPPWDKIKPERDGFYLAYDPLIRQLQGTEKNRRIEDLHRQNPTIAEAWRRYEFSQKTLADILLGSGIYCHQTAVVEEEVEGDNGGTTTKKKTTGGDPDCFKFFLERAWQLVGQGRTVGMVMSSSLHHAQGCTGLRRLMLELCSLRILCNFDNERKIFPGIDNRQDFDIVVFEKGGETERFDAAFLTRETEKAIQRFRLHRSHLLFRAEDVRRLSPQMLTFFEFKGQRDVELVQKAYRLHPMFGECLMPKLGLQFRREFDMGNSNFLFRTREWLRRHGCTQEPGEQWRAADAEWYRARGYIERPIANWYVLFEGQRAKKHLLPWTVKSARSIKEQDLDDFIIRLDLPGNLRLIAKGPDDGGEQTVFVPSDEARSADLPVYIPGVKKLEVFSIAPSLRPLDVFLPLIEGKWIYHFDERAYAYVSGSGSWIVTRPTNYEEVELSPHYFLLRLDVKTRTPISGHLKIGFRDVSSASNERTLVAACVPLKLPCNHKTPTFASLTASDCDLWVTSAWLSSLVNDYIVRVTGGTTSLSAVKNRPAPFLSAPLQEILSDLVSRFSRHCPRTRLSEDSKFLGLGRQRVDELRALLDTVMAEQLELTTYEYAYVLSTFPLLDRDQPPLPHDYRIRPTNKGVERRRISFITRDLALLTYFDYLAGRLDIKPDPERLARICPDGVPEPPSDIVQFFAEAGVDIGGQGDHAVAATGPFRDLRERVARARDLGAIAYIPTIDRRRARFVEEAAAAGGLSPEEGVLTPEMAERVLRDKAEREAKWKKAMALWEVTPLDHPADDTNTGQAPAH